MKAMPRTNKLMCRVWPIRFGVAFWRVLWLRGWKRSRQGELRVELGRADGWIWAALDGLLIALGVIPALTPQAQAHKVPSLVWGMKGTQHKPRHLERHIAAHSG